MQGKKESSNSTWKKKSETYLVAVYNLFRPNSKFQVCFSDNSKVKIDESKTCLVALVKMLLGGGDKLHYESETCLVAVVVRWGREKGATLDIRWT